MNQLRATRHLFTEVHIQERFAKMRNYAKSAVDEMDDGEILSCNVGVTVEELIAQFRIEFPKIASPETESSTPLRTGGEPTRYITTIAIPFSGEREIFRTKPATSPAAPPAAALHETAIHYTTMDTSPNAEVIKAEVDRTIRTISQYLQVLSKEWDQQFEQLANEVSRQIAQRRGDLERAGRIVQALGYPLRCRDDPSGMAVPIVRKKILSAVPQNPVRPVPMEPHIEEAIYTEILNVLASMSLLVERNPTTFAHIDEPALRDHFLLQLNGQFEGKATGETFNGSGKTDILLREGDKNLFIAECKFWDGAKSLTDAIDQLLGYATWRDSKAAILVFSRRKDFTRTIEDAGRTLQAHPQFRQLLPIKRETSFRAWIARSDDEQRRIDLAVMLFNIPSSANSLTRVTNFAF